MKNSWLLIMGALLIGGLPSCKKGDKTCSLGKHYLSDGSTTPNADAFSYYQDGRLKTIEYANGAMDTVSYSADTMTVTGYDRYDSLVSVFTAITNASGAAISGVKNTYDYSGAL